MTVKPKQKAFGPKDIITFLVTFKNVGRVGLMLYDAGAGYGQDFVIHTAFGVYGKIQDVHVVDMMEDWGRIYP